MSIKFLQKIQNGLIVTLIFLSLVIAGVYIYAKFLEQPDLIYKPLPFPITALAIYPGGFKPTITF